MAVSAFWLYIGGNTASPAISGEDTVSSFLPGIVTVSVTLPAKFGRIRLRYLGAVKEAEHSHLSAAVAGQTGA